MGIALQRTETLASDILFADVDRLMFASDDPQNVVQDSEHAIQTALEKVMAELKRLEHVQHTGAQIMFVRGDDELEIMHSTNSSDVGLMVPIGKSVSGRAVRERETIISRRRQMTKKSMFDCSAAQFAARLLSRFSSVKRTW